MEVMRVEFEDMLKGTMHKLNEKFDNKERRYEKVPLPSLPPVGAAAARTQTQTRTQGTATLVATKMSQSHTR